MNGAVAALSVRAVTKHHGARRALDRVDLEVPAGTVVALLGPNGAGKSTLVSLAAGLSAPDAGSVRVCGRDPRSGRAADRRLVGLAAQEIALYPGLTAAENLRCFGEVAGMTRRDARRRVGELAPSFALGPLLDRPSGQLSGGEQRRLHAAVALVHRPALVLLDEPTAGADVVTRNAILDAVGHLTDDGTAVLYTTHYLPEVEQLAAGVAIIVAGRVLVTGEVGDLVAAHVESAVVLSFTTAEEARAAGALPDAAVDGVRVRVLGRHPDRLLPELLARLADHLSGLRAVDVLRPSLETVYLALTASGAAAAASVDAAAIG